MEQEYLEILKDYLFTTWKILIVPILVIIIIMIITLAKNNWKIICKRKYNKSIILEFVLVLLILISGTIYTIPVIFDITQNSIKIEQYEYAYYYNQAYSEDNYGLFQQPILVVKKDNTKIQLNDTTYDFPFEIENGTIIYATHSKIILEYSGTIINQDSF